MTLPAPISALSLHNATDLQAGLRIHQRVTAQVLSVTGTSVTLEVEGHPIVAQLSSADQAAVLTSQRMAQFIVTALSAESVTLKLVQNEAAPTGAAAAPVGDELAARILSNTHLPATNANLILTRAMLQQRLPITPELLRELQNALNEFGAWTESDADLAAALKSAGLPVTRESLALMSQPSVQTADALAKLIQALSQSSSPSAGNLLAQLNALIVHAENPPSKMATQLKALAQMLGQSLENSLLGQNAPEKIPVLLAGLQKQFEESQMQDEAQIIKEFLQNIRQSHFLNVKPEPVPGEGEWSEIGFTIQNGAEKFSAARLKIAREPKADSRRINPEYTRLILQVDISPDETIEADISLVGKHIRTAVTSPNPAWCEQARNEIPSLTEALKQLGYQINDAQVGVGVPQPFARIQIRSTDAHWMTVNIEA